MIKKYLFMLVGITLMIPCLVFARTSAPAGAKAYIISPSHGETVTNPITIKFGLQGMGVAPAGVDKANTGHHHLLIDAAVPPLDKPIPSDDTHKHFGGGQTEVTITLSPGKHTLQLLLGDKGHVPFDPLVASEVISVEVK